ncbi:hypothetical protein BC831DRAFT_448634 [Entophlyctis helioformis]|nr:hypothetical protein BC831DRAFT_448634 [Entophlyctis helioformis]
MRLQSTREMDAKAGSAHADRLEEHHPAKGGGDDRSNHAAEQTDGATDVDARLLGGRFSGGAVGRAVGRVGRLVGMLTAPTVVASIVALGMAKAVPFLAAPSRQTRLTGLSLNGRCCCCTTALQRTAATELVHVAARSVVACRPPARHRHHWRCRLCAALLLSSRCGSQQPAFLSADASRQAATWWPARWTARWREKRGARPCGDCDASTAMRLCRPALSAGSVSRTAATNRRPVMRRWLNGRVTNGGGCCKGLLCRDGAQGCWTEGELLDRACGECRLAHRQSGQTNAPIDGQRARIAGASTQTSARF